MSRKRFVGYVESVFMNINQPGLIINMNWNCPALNVNCHIYLFIIFKITLITRYYMGVKRIHFEGRIQIAHVSAQNDEENAWTK
jgi:hypothetical protein